MDKINTISNTTDDVRYFNKECAQVFTWKFNFFHIRNIQRISFQNY